MRVLVCGGRDFSDRNLVARTLAPYKRAELIIDGAANGADQLASEWAEVFGVPNLRFPADWRKHGRAAGPLRNQRMIDEGRPDLVVAFPGGRGTADMIRRAEQAGIEIIRAGGEGG